MVDKLKGFFLVLLVVLLSAVFALQFGGGQAEGCAAGGTSYVARVYDKTISRGDFESAYSIGNFGRLPAETQQAMGLPQLVLDGLIDRTLLAREARKVGFQMTDDEVMERFVNDGTILLSLGTNAPPEVPQGEIPVSFTDKDGAFNADLAKRYIQNGLRRSVGEFAQAQADEYLAAQMRELVASTVNVSNAEAWDDYVRENDRAELEYVRFAPAYFAKRAPVPTDADIAAWTAANEEQLTSVYEASKYRFTNLDKQVRSRQVLVKSDSYDSDETRTQAKEKAETIRARAVGGEDFASLARSLSEDEVTAAKGGDLGFRAKGTMPEAYDDAVFDLEVGEISEVIETDFGYHVATIVAVREGDVPEDEARRELAEGLYRNEWIKTQAQEAAAKALALWKSNGSDALRRDINSKNEKNAGATLAPSLSETGSFGRDEVPLVGLSTSALLDAVFDVEEGESFPEEPVLVGREWVIFRIVDRRRPDETAFTDDLRDSTREVLRTLKEKEALDLYIRKLREQAAEENALRINPLPLRDGNS